MIPFYKVFSLLLRTLSKPLLAYTKKVHSSREAQSRLIRHIFIFLGNFYHRFDSYINRQFLKIKSQSVYKPLNDELAIQKGIQFFYQIIFYCIVIGLPLYEMWRAAAESAQKTAQLNHKLTLLEEGSNSALLKLQQAGELLSSSRSSLLI